MYLLKAAVLLSGPFFLLATTVMAVLGRTAWWLVAFLLLTNAAMLWRSDRFLLRSLHTERLDEQVVPGLFGIVQNLARRQSLQLPRIHVLHEAAPTALIVSHSAGTRHIVLTAGLLESFNASELAAVIAHQMSLLETYKAFVMTIAAMYAIALEKLGFSGTVAAAVTRFATPGSTRFVADASGAHLLGSATPLIQALTKIEGASVRLPALPAIRATRHLFICDPLANPFLRGRGIGPSVAERVLRLKSLAFHAVPAVAP